MKRRVFNLAVFASLLAAIATTLWWQIRYSTLDMLRLYPGPCLIAISTFEGELRIYFDSFGRGGDAPKDPTTKPWLYIPERWYVTYPDDRYAEHTEHNRFGFGYGYPPLFPPKILQLQQKNAGTVNELFIARANQDARLGRVRSATTRYAELQAQLVLDRQPRHLIEVPLWFCVLSFSILPALRLIAYTNNLKRANARLCAKCGYDLRATPERCPECGTVPALTPSPREGRGLG